MLGHTYKSENLFWSETRGVVNAEEGINGWISYSGEFTMGCATKGLFDAEFKPMIPEDCDVRKILLKVVPGDGSGHEVYAKNVSEVEELLSEMGQKIEDFELSRQTMTRPEIYKVWDESDGSISDFAACLIAAHEYSKVEVFTKPHPKLSEAEFDALDTALCNLKHHRPLNHPAQKAIPVIRAMLLAHDPNYQEVKF